MSRAFDGPPVVLELLVGDVVQSRDDGDVVRRRRLEPEEGRRRTPLHNEKPFVHLGIVLRGLAPDGVLSRCSRWAATTQHAKVWQAHKRTNKNKSKKARRRGPLQRAAATAAAAAVAAAARAVAAAAVAMAVVVAVAVWLWLWL